MALVFAAIVPHSPLLVPNIGKENMALFAATLAATTALSEDFKAAKPDVVIVLTSHGHARQSGFVYNIAEHFTADLSAFGDLVTSWEFSGSIDLPARFREKLEDKASIQLTTDTKLDYGSAIPLSLMGISAATPVVPISQSGQKLSEQAAFGKHLQTCILDEHVNIAVIASADLSHRVSKKSPAGYSAKAKKLDQKIIEGLTRGDSKEILAISPAALEDAAIEDFGTIAILLGILEGINCRAELLSYEAPFGVGHPVVRYRLS